uniref:Uncharacterized protein n=1 Tax=Acrobeloides nanus TaxID=290746 RepID=A0A914DCB4_9BILA
MADLKEFSLQLLYSNPSNTYDAKMENGFVEVSLFNQQVDVHRNDNVQSEDRKNEATGCEGRHKKNDLVDTKDPSNEPSKEESIKDNKEEAPREEPQGDDDNDAKGFKMLDNKPGDRMKHENNGNNKQFNQSQSNHNAISEQQL